MGQIKYKPTAEYDNVVGVGMRFRGGHALDYAINSAEKGEIFLLEREPENEYDPAAIKILARPANGLEPWPIAYVNREDATYISGRIDEGEKLVFVFAETVPFGRQKAMMGDVHEVESGLPEVYLQDEAQ